MRLCLVTGAFPPQRCGIGDYTECLGRHLAGMGVEAHVVTSIHRSGGRHAALKLHRIIRRWNFVGAIRLLSALRKIKPDVVHLQFPSVEYGRVAWLSLMPGILRALKYKVVLTLHEYTIAQRLSRARQLAMAAAATEVITTNLQDCTALRRRLFWKPGRIHRINIASNIEVPPAGSFDRDARRGLIGAQADSSVICFFGNLHPEKGLDDLVEAFGIVNSEIPDTKLLIIGTFSPSDTLYSCMLRRKIVEADLLDKVHITGFVTPQQVSEFLLASDICVLPFPDGLSVRRGSFFAAVHHGLPVITTSPQSPLPDSMIDGENVVLVTPGNIQQLAESIETLARSPEIRSRIKQNLVILDRRFAWPEIARRTLEVYNST